MEKLSSMKLVPGAKSLRTAALGFVLRLHTHGGMKAAAWANEEAENSMVAMKAQCIAQGTLELG